MTEQTLLKGPLTIAYEKEGAKWYATALEFDLVGIGSTRKKAGEEVKQLFREYLYGCLDEEGPVRFVFPAEASVWNSEDKEWYHVTVSLSLPKSSRKEIPRSLNLSELKSQFRNRIESIGLVPAGV